MQFLAAMSGLHSLASLGRDIPPRSRTVSGGDLCILSANLPRGLEVCEVIPTQTRNSAGPFISCFTESIRLIQLDGLHAISNSMLLVD